jgi:uncharacterized membrane protein YccC
MIRKRAILAGIAGAVAMPALIFLRDYPWQLAAPVAVAVGIFVYLAAGTLDRHRR